MMRSLFSGVTGLRSHQTRMDVIGNNIANVNTVGFKKSTVTFADLYSETLNPASAPSGNLGGINAQQVGLGVGINSIVIQHSPGASQYTGNVLNAAINGDGFYTVRLAPGEYRYTRAGDFSVDSSGQLVMQGTGYLVQTFNAQYTKGTQGAATVNGWTNKATTNAELLSFTGTGNHIQQTTSGTYTFEIGYSTVVPPATPVANSFVIKRNGVELPMSQQLDITSNTDFTIYDSTGTEVPAATATLTGAAPDGTKYSVSIAGYGDFEFTVKAGQSIPNTIAGVLTEFGDLLNNVTLTVKNNDNYAPGNRMGDMVIDSSLYQNVSIGKDGSIIVQLKEAGTIPGTDPPIVAAAGEKIVLGYLAMAQFDNYQGMEKIGDNLYQRSPNSGMPTYGIAGENGAGSLTPSSLEMSNVDLADEMVNMIITQRGFQANSRIITTSDSLLEELVNLKR